MHEKNLQHSVVGPSRPLDNFSVIRTRDADEMSAAVRRFFGEHSFQVVKGAKYFNALGNYLQLNDIGISYGGFGTAVKSEYQNSPTGFTILAGIRGSGVAKTAGRTIPFDAEQTVVFSPGRPAALAYDDSYQTFNVQIDPGALIRKLEGMADIRLEKQLMLDPAMDFRQPEAACWKDLLHLLISQADSRTPNMPKVAMFEIEQALMVTLLRIVPHRFSHLLTSKPNHIAPWQVRRVEEYIEAHWDQPITIEALAAATNSSARSIFYSFKKNPRIFAYELCETGSARTCKADALSCDAGQLRHGGGV